MSSATPPSQVRNSDTNSERPSNPVMLAGPHLDLTGSRNRLSNEERKAMSFQLFQARPIPFWKRLIDVVVSLILCVVLAPVLLAIAAYIRMVAGGPVFFKQVRLGEMGRDFEILKFRTLKPSPNATADHREFIASFKGSDEAVAKPDFKGRLIPGGGILRKASLDELPQLLNILRGDMSLIGPRPDVLKWDDYETWQLQRFEVRPGVTGLWQVSGKNRLSLNQMIEKDIEYIAKRSFGFDAKIIWKTLRMICKFDNG